MSKQSKNIETLYSLSSLQQGLLFHSLLEPESGVYFEQLSCTLAGTFHPEAFRQAWQKVVDRHAPLRTLFVWQQQTQPIQVVVKKVHLPWQQLDWRAFSTEQKQIQLQQLLKQDLQQGFIFEQAPLMRMTLIQMDEQCYQFVWSFHHIILDGWSTAVVLKEVLASYEGKLQDAAPMLSPAQPYREYIHWLQQQDSDAAEQYWRQYLQGFTTPTHLALPRPAGRNNQSAHEFGQCSLYLSTERTAQLQSRAQAQHLTMNTLVQGAWALLLSRYSAQTDVLFGATVSGRPTALIGVEHMVGLFINALPVRVQVEPTQLLGTWLQQLQLQQVEQKDFAYSPLVDIQKWSEVPAGHPLFESLIVFENYPVDQSLKGSNISLEISNLQVREQTNYPLTISVAVGDEMGLQLKYDGRIYDEGTMVRLMNHLQILLEAISEAGLECPLGQLPMLRESERQQLLYEWNDTATEVPDLCLHQLFEQQVEQTPEAVAVIYEEQQLTYQELNQRANQLAHYLQSLGVGPDVPVGICLERSIETLVGLLGILKAGGACVPLDPGYPQDRLIFMLNDSQVPVLLTHSSIAEWATTVDAQIVLLDQWQERIDVKSQTSPQSTVSPKHLAYVIYTSGSTGIPKGVMVEHCNLCNHMYWMQTAFPLTQADKVLQKTPISFDASIWEFYAPLLAGGQLVIAQPGGHQDSTYLIEQIATQEITTLKLVPSLLRMLLEHRGLETCKSLKRIFCGGEVLPANLQEPFFAHLNAKLYNLYGPTEAAIDVTFWKCALGEKVNIPIGRPIANTQIYVLDTEQQPVPIGVSGEIYIGGAGVARGYLNRPELTAQKFIADPFSSEGRLYRTGDLARYRPDGNLEFIGRVDNQVKLRGFRIELGEIEAALSEHPQVQQVVVIVQGESADDKHLVAYVVGEKVSIEAIRKYLSEKLPEYMVPAFFVLLDELPLTPNGKIDRKALPKPEIVRSDAQFVAPRTPIEKLLVNIWKQVLGLEQVSVHDNFFEVGGHSLLATQLISRIRDSFTVELPLRELFAQPTIAGLAQVIQRVGQSEHLAPSIIPVSRDEQLPLSFAQQRLWFLDQLEGANANYKVSAVLRLTGSLDVHALQQCLNTIIQRHETLRTSFQTVEGMAFQVIAEQLAIPIKILNLEALDEATQTIEVQKLIRQEAQEPFDLATGPLIRVKVLQLESEEQVLLLTMHHIISDGWSMGVLVEEVTSLYQAFTTDTEAALPTLPVQYADFAHWQRQYLQGEVLENHLSYWKKQLADAPPLLELPTDRPRPAVQSFQGSIIPFALSAELTRQLQQLSQEMGTTLFMTLLSAFQVLLYRYSGQEDIVVGSPIANRNHSEIENLIGFFVNTLALRSHLDSEMSFEQLLKQVRQTTLDAYTHQDVPFEKLVDELQPERSLSYSPLFQVSFVLQNAPMGALALRDLQLQPMRGQNDLAKFDDIAKFDLTVSLTETEQGIKGDFEYNTDLFDKQTVERMNTHFQILLEHVTTNPYQQVSQLSMLTEAEVHKLLYEWNDTALDYPCELCIHQLFEQQVEQTPEAVAVVFEDQHLTYRALNQKANQLAHYLQSLGVDPDVPVGIYLERSMEMLVGILGVLKAGGAYVPLDPNYPQERLVFMIEDSQVPVLLTQEHLTENLPAIWLQVLLVEDLWPTLLHDYPQCNPPRAVTANHLAYVIYTSGSTGTPKGVMVEHKGACNLATAQVRLFNVRPDSCVLQFASSSFDASVWEWMMALCSGAKLCLCTPAQLLPGAPLLQTLSQQSVTHVTLPPSVLAALPYEELPSLQTIIVAGEKAPPGLVAKWSTGRRFFNAYGPTESTVCATVAECIEEDNVLIGRPIANTQIYLLDQQQQPVPIGVSGEIYIGGVGIARGYLNQPELTEEKFVPNPFNNSPEALLYRTGDLARYRPDGNLEFIGRIDDQVKLRGFRIELGEIEAALSQHIHVKQALVTVQEESADSKRLVAYVLPAQTEEVSVSDLREYLKEKLPQYMIPNFFVLLDEVSLTPNGKLDRKALQQIDLTQTKQGANLVLPRNSTELQLALIWEEILNIHPIGVQDNFFDLGGHSLLAVSLMAKIQKHFETSLPLASLLQNPTIEQLICNVLAQPTQPKDPLYWSPLVPIQPRGSEPPFFCVPGSAMDVLGFYHLAYHLGSEQPFYGLQPRGLDGEFDPLNRIEDIAACYIEAVQTIQPQGPYYLGGYSFGATVAFEMSQQLAGHGHEVAFLALMDSTVQAPIEKPAYIDNKETRALTFFGLGQRIESFFEKKVELSYDTLLTLAPDEQLDYVSEQMKVAGIPAGSKQLRGFLQVYYADSKAMELYVQRNLHPIPITLFRAEISRPIAPELSEIWKEILTDPTWGWSRFSSEPIDLHYLPGDHVTMMTEPHVMTLAKQIRICISEAQTRNGEASI